ncbi:phosphomannomutase/phosphoglucomutase [Brachybacterium huguangmaarense]
MSDTNDMSDMSEMTGTGAATPDLGRIVTANDIRGVAGVDLTEDIARALGAAFADLLDGGDMIVAHDMRVSSPALSRAFVEGAVRRGATVAVAGLSSTDQLYCASGLHQAAGAMFTASHNPAPDNGIKLCLPGARPISRSTGLAAIRESAERYLASPEGIPEREGGRQEELDTLGDYVELVSSLVAVPQRRPLRVVVDAANAMAGHTVPALEAALPSITVVPLHFELDGSFPSHEANPLDPANLVDLREAVVREGADLGLAFDGDADRCVVVDETGRPVPPSAITALIARREIARARAAGQERPAVVANLVSSRHVAEAIEDAGGRHIRSRVGHSLIKALMAENDAVFGGEHSAHYYFRDFFFADSGMLAALHVLAALAESDVTASELAASSDPYVASGEINSRVPDAQAALEAVRAALGAREGIVIDELDGMTISHWDGIADAADRWWLSLRSSNTEELLRLNVEAEEESTMEEIRDEVLGIVRAEPAEPAESAPIAGATEASGADIPSWVRERVRCPVCGGDLTDRPRSLACTACGRAYPVEGGIPVLIPGAATTGD